MQALFQVDQNAGTTLETLDAFIDDRIEMPALRDFARQLVRITRDRLADIDAILAESSANWRVGRMPVVDRSVLRLAVCELRFLADAPEKVVINEAIEICKKYSTAESPAFINGILDRVAGLRSRSSIAPQEATLPDQESVEPLPPPPNEES